LIAGNVPGSIEETMMTTALRKRMIDAMVLRGFSLRTRESHVACVATLARYYRCSPDSLDAAQIQAYLLHLIQERKLAYASVNQAVCAIRFLLARVLGREAVALEVPMAKVPKRLPQVLSREEVGRLLAAARRRTRPHRADDDLRRRAAGVGAVRA
jgi:integrase/recombinase XerD